ncbi:MAG: hypothetical protein AAF141_04745 [Pseudomonadota bacterium]
MPDYHAVLNKTLAGLPQNTPEMRSKVYEKARATIRRQLDAVQPALPGERIEAEIANLEAAIIDVEAAQAPPEPILPAEDDLLGDLEAELGIEPAPASEPTLSAAVPTASPPAPAAPVTPTPPPVEPGLGAFPPPRADDPSLGAAPVPPARPVSAEAERPSGGSAPVGAPEPDKRSRKGLIAFLILLFVLLGGAVAASQSEGGLNGLVQRLVPGVEIPFLGIAPEEASNDGPSDPTPVPAGTDEPTAPSDDAEAETKFNERLGSDGETTAAEPEPQPVEQPVDDSQLVPADPADPSVEGPGEGGPTLDPQTETDAADPQPQPGDVVVDENGVQFTVPSDGTDAAAPATQEQGQTAPAAGATVAQRAFFYVENGGAEGTTRVPGTVIWSNGERDGLPTIDADVSIGELGIGVKMVIRKNVDETLSASHVIDILFDLPDGFTGNGISSVRQVVFKPTEEEQGNALIAEPAKISDTFFIVALYDLAEAEAANTQIMRERPWIDLPIAYTTGRRALLTIEKGARGSDVFRRAFDAWANAS